MIEFVGESIQSGEKKEVLSFLLDLAECRLTLCSTSSARTLEQPMFDFVEKSLIRSRFQSVCLVWTTLIRSNIRGGSRV